MSRLLFLGKRHPQQRDLLTRPYGRFHHLSTELAQRGHEVHVVLVSHRRLANEVMQRDGVHWYSDDVLSSGPRAFTRIATDLCKQQRMDWIIGCSDLYYGIAAVNLAAKFGARAAIDAYDNFESYMGWAAPLHWLWRRALTKADLVTAVGPQLAERLQRHHRRKVEVIPMSADPQFVAGDRRAARERLHLPLDVPLLGHCGSFTATRGSQVLIDAFTAARARIPDLRLVMTGRYPRELERVPGVLGLGFVADELMPSVLNSVDAIAVLLADTEFGRYSYPAKLYEAMACRIPLVASATGPARWILDGAESHLASVGDAVDLAEKLVGLLRDPAIRYPQTQAWPQIAERFETVLRNCSPN